MLIHVLTTAVLAAPPEVDSPSEAPAIEEEAVHEEEATHEEDAAHEEEAAHEEGTTHGASVGVIEHHVAHPRHITGVKLVEVNVPGHMVEGIGFGIGPFFEEALVPEWLDLEHRDVGPCTPSFGMRDSCRWGEDQRPVAGSDLGATQRGRRISG